MPRLLHSRAAAMASSSVSPATKRRAMLRVEPLAVTKCANFWLCASLSSVDRSMKDDYAREGKRELVSVLFQELLGVYGGHAAGAGGGDGLAIAVVLHISGDENARHPGQAAVPGDEVAVLVHIELAPKHGRVRDVTDSHEEAVDFDDASIAALRIADFHALHRALRGNDFLDDGWRHEFDFLIGSCAIKHDFRRAKFVAAVNQMHFAGVAREEIGFLHGGVAAANNRNGLAAEEEAVTGGARRNAVADKFALAGETEHARGSAGGDDQSPRDVVHVAGFNAKRPDAQIHVGDGAGAKFRAEFLRLFAHVFDEFRTHDAVRKARKILDVGGERKLAAGFVPINHHGLKVGASRIDGGGEAGAATSNDDDVMHSRFSTPLDSARRLLDTKEETHIVAPGSGRAGRRGSSPVGRCLPSSAI